MECRCRQDLQFLHEMQQMNIRANPKLNEFGKCVYSIGEHLSAFVLYPEVYTSVKGKSVKKWRGGGANVHCRWVVQVLIP